MCTVTYIPTNEGFIITSTRDEAPERTSSAPNEHDIGGKRILFPKEPLSGGTWIAADRVRVLCLLNGAFVKHIHRPPYKLSRGIMLLQAFAFRNCYEFSGKYDCKGIEPFTLIWAEEDKLSELRWDSTMLHHTPLSASKEHIWASSTLYEPQIQMLRKDWFDHFLSQIPHPTVEQILEFHATPKLDQPQNDIVMRREKVRSVSITAMEMKNGVIHCSHKDLESQSLTNVFW